MLSECWLTGVKAFILARCHLSSSRIISLGSINTDFVVRGPRLPKPGETVVGGDFYLALEGKGANQAIAAARLESNAVTFLAALGADQLGEQALTVLRHENMICDYVRIVPNVASGVAIILVDEFGENLISVASGANAHLTPEDMDRVPDKVFAAARVFLASCESPLPTVIRGLQRARKFGPLTVLNPAPAAVALVNPFIIQLVDVLTPNEHELAALVGENSPDTSSLIKGARELQKLGSRQVIVTLGAQGCLLVDQQVASIAVRPVQAIDTTAAGDAFNGALAVKLAVGDALRDAVTWASLAATLTVTRRGAQPSLPHAGKSKLLPRSTCPSKIGREQVAQLRYAIPRSLQPGFV